MHMLKPRESPMPHMMILKIQFFFLNLCLEKWQNLPEKKTLIVGLFFKIMPHIGLAIDMKFTYLHKVIN
jgi:hypothetical protein